MTHAEPQSGLVLATNNPGKLREIAALLAPLGLTVTPQGALGIPEAEETGLTFVENAILKARHAAAASGRPAIADDSGLAVDALGGAPGIWSARYASREAAAAGEASPTGDRDMANCARLLAALEGVPPSARTARFHCLMVYLRHAADPTPIICEGTWEGRILPAPRGDNGFGYDPVFLVPEHGCSAAELDAVTKNRLSHRGAALRALIARLPGARGEAAT